MLCRIMNFNLFIILAVIVVLNIVNLNKDSISNFICLTLFYSFPIKSPMRHKELGLGTCTAVTILQ